MWSVARQGQGPKKMEEVASFVMVLWLEARDPPNEPEWRWRVVEIPTGERHYFLRIADLLAYVSERAGVPPPQ